MSIKATCKSSALPRLSRRDFTLQKAVVLAALISLGLMTGHLEAAADGGFAGFKAAFCDEVDFIEEA